MSRHSGATAQEVRFPLGGIGTGSISLAGNGHLTDVEIFNHPDKGYNHGYSHFAIKAEEEGKLVDARLLQGDWRGQLSGQWTLRDRLRKRHTGYGVGPDCETLAGMPHFADCEFSGEFPFARLQLRDSAFPGEVAMTAFNPFIPGDEDSSSLPVACFEFEIANSGERTLDYSLCLTLGNGLAPQLTQNRHELRDGRHAMILSQSLYPQEDPRHAELAMITDAQDVSWQSYWYRGDWFDSLTLFWRDFCRHRRFPERQYAESLPGVMDHATLAAHLRLAPGQRRSVRFWLGWYCPTTWNYWSRWRDRQTEEIIRYADYQGQPVWRNHYATRFADVGAVLDYSIAHADYLFSRSVDFQRALHDSSLPANVAEAISANLAVLKSPTCLRLEDGSLWGWEGVLEDIGCCEGSCTHVWDYALALPYLFPRLSRSLRDLNQRYNLRPSGSLRFRLRLPLGEDPFEFRACADGQFGEVLAIYRDWLLCGDTAWLTRKWPAVRALLTFSWSDDNPDRWDPQRSGVLSGRQHHTLDMELFGANPWLTGLYIAALEAGSAVAERLGHHAEAQEWRAIARRGKKSVARELFNGDYFCQQIDIADRSLLAPWREGEESADYGLAGDIWRQYWCEENQQIKYQLANACHIDQLMGQWFAWLCGLEPVFDAGQAQKALQALYRHNFLSCRDYANPCRLYALNDERGTVIAAWPQDDAPAIPIPYAQEMMTGFEYQLAALMAATGMTDAAETLAGAIRDRYRGDNRNPWNEMECGSHYARSLASYGLLLAYSGFHYHADARRLSFRPAQARAHHRYFWSIDAGWGTVNAGDGECELRVLHGQLSLQTFCWPCADRPAGVELNGRPVAARYQDDGGIHFSETIVLRRGDALRAFWPNEG